MTEKSKGSSIVFLIVGSLFLLLLPSCASPSGISSSIHNLAARNDCARAKAFLEKNQRHYGANNRLLYFLDRGMLLHLCKDYQESNNAFEQAKKEYEKLYTKSVTGIIGSWLFNEYTLPYAGEDFERVLINIFGSMNYVMLNDLQGALVEARDVDETLRLINSRYDPGRYNVYREDAFARLLIGVLYEASLNPEGYNNAFISYKKSAQIYADDYARLYQVPMPSVLKENLLAAAQWMGDEEFTRTKADCGDIPFQSLAEKSKKAEVYLIHYNGPAPVKTEIVVPIPLPDGNIVTLALAKYDRHYPVVRFSELVAEKNENASFRSATEIVQDINAIAIKNLENKRSRIVAKAVATSAGKYLLEKALQQKIKEKFGQTAEINAILLSSLFNIYTNRADLRSWQTIPSKIYLARLLLDPGEYSLRVDHFNFQHSAVGQKDLGKVHLYSGDKRFFIIKT
ncbi:MAG TPA: hypothetical protein PLO93_06900, partial [Candidatus Omnitrophota bacterium]|nr:hypothetical protein [Candidatus Omnitrophota bacterium]